MRQVTSLFLSELCGGHRLDVLPGPTGMSIDLLNDFGFVHTLGFCEIQRTRLDV